MTNNIGPHIASRDYISFEKDVKKVKKAGGNLVQIFIPKKDTLKMYRNIIDKENIKLVIHSSYLHNIANDWNPDSWWINNIISEIRSAYKLKAIGVILHFGKSKELSHAKALNNMYTSLMYIHNKTKQYNNIKIILETSTGQGTEMCYQLDKLSYFYKKIFKLHNRIKLCIDTCHIFSAGYDLRSKEDVILYLDNFEELIGIKNVCIIHLNDCKVPLGDKKDRHESIGKGYIGLKGLKIFFDYFNKLGIPTVLETPNDSYQKEIKLLTEK